MTPVRTVAGIGVGTALLSVLAGCLSKDSSDGTVGVSAPISGTSRVTDASQYGGTPGRTTAAPAESLFNGPAPVSIVTWWREYPAAAPDNLADRTLLFNEQGEGPQRFPGPDVRKYNRILMIITCSSKSEYLVRLQVLDGLSIASTSGTSCGGPTLSAYTTPFLKVTETKTEVEVQVPDDTKYFVTLYGNPA